MKRRVVTYGTTSRVARQAHSTATCQLNINPKNKELNTQSTSVASNETSTTTFLSDDEYSKRQVTAMLVSSHFRSCRNYVYLLSCTERRPNTDPWPATGTTRLILMTHMQLGAGSVALTSFQINRYKMCTRLWKNNLKQFTSNLHTGMSHFLYDCHYNIPASKTS